MSYIVPMEKPKRCGLCPCFHAEHPMHCMAVEGHRTVGAPYGMPRPDWCPLVEVPPHGRLIDADKLIEELKECADAANSNWEYEKATGYSNSIESVEEALTIVDAEGEKDGR